VLAHATYEGSFFEEVLDRHFGGRWDEKTLELFEGGGQWD
jgi:uncharacterized protein (DUF1810 family)